MHSKLNNLRNKIQKRDTYDKESLRYLSEFIKTQMSNDKVSINDRRSQASESLKSMKISN